MVTDPLVARANAVKRTYLITPNGGSGYTATLRLRYADADLNGNAENTLELWRYNGGDWETHGATARAANANWVFR